MKRTISFLVLILLIVNYGCDCGTNDISSIYLKKIGGNILDCRVAYQMTYSNGYKEKGCITGGNKIDTKTIQYFINKQIIVFNDTILPNDNLWKNLKTKKFIKYTESYDNYSDLIFDQTFYDNILLDTSGLVITFKAITDDNIELVAQYKK